MHNTMTSSARFLNAEGFPAYERSREEQYLQLLLTNTLGGTFYATSDQLATEATDLHLDITTNNPDFATRALLYARQYGMMRMQPIMGLAFLSGVDRDNFYGCFDTIIQTPDDLATFVNLLTGGTLPLGLTRRTKRAVNRWLGHLSEYHALKYTSQLRGVMRRTHPKPDTAYQAAIFEWIHNRKNASLILTPQIAAYEELITAVRAQDQHAIQRLIGAGRLPYELVTGILKPDTLQWRTLARQMPYMALLRHLNMLKRHGALWGQFGYIAQRLSDIDAMKRARVLPFRLLTALNNFQPTVYEEPIQAALIQALDGAAQNLPPLAGTICIAPDVSQSMSGRMSAKGLTRYIDIAALFAASLLKKATKAVVLPFNQHVIDVSLRPAASVYDSTLQIVGLLGGGTSLSAPISFLLEHKIAVDTFIGITDNIEWITQKPGQGFLPVWNHYTRLIAPQARAFLIVLAPYRSAVAPPSTPNVHFIYGWSDLVLKYIGLMQHSTYHVLAVN